MKKILWVWALASLPSLALAVAPEDYYHAGADLFKNHDYEKAIQYFHAAVDERPDYWQAYESLGMAYYQNGNVTAAVMAMEKSLQLHPDNPELKKFEANIRATSPWASRGYFTGILPILAILISLLSAAWTFYWIRRAKNHASSSHP